MAAAAAAAEPPPPAHAASAAAAAAALLLLLLLLVRCACAARAGRKPAPPRPKHRRARRSCAGALGRALAVLLVAAGAWYAWAPQETRSTITAVEEALGPLIDRASDVRTSVLSHPHVESFLTHAAAAATASRKVAATSVAWIGEQAHIVRSHPQVQAAIESSMASSLWLAEVAGNYAQAGLTSASATCREALAHPRVQYVLTHPLVQDSLAHPLVQGAIAHPLIHDTLAHPQVAGVLASPHSLLLVPAAVLSSLLFCCCCYRFCWRRSRSRKKQQSHRSKKPKGSEEFSQAFGTKHAKATKQEKNGGKLRLRGAAECELREETTPSALHTLLKVCAPILFPFKIAGMVLSVLGGAVRGGTPPPPSNAPTRVKSLRPSLDSTESVDAPQGSAAASATKKARPKEVAHTHPRLLATLKGFSEPVSAAMLSQDGQLAAAVSSDRTLRVFTSLHEAGVKALPSPMLANVPLDHATALSISANGRNIILATEMSRRLLAYTVTQPNQKMKAGVVLKREFPPKAEAHSQTICAVLLAPNSKFIATVGGGTDLAVKLWSINGELIASVENKQLTQHGAAVSADSKFIAVAADASPPHRTVSPRHGQVAILEVGYDVRGNAYRLTQAMCIGGHTRGIPAVSFASDCVHLALASRDGEWTVWRTDVRYDLKVEPEEYARAKASSGPLECIALSPFATRLVGAAAGKIDIYDVAAAARGGKASYLIETIEAGHGRVSTLNYSSDGLRALSGGEDGKLRLWRVENDESKAGTI